MSKTIQLTQGKVAIVDDADFDWLNQWKWHASKQWRSGKFYAARTDHNNGKHRAVFMHNQIMGKPDGLDVDHKDRDGLNNQRQNLRYCTHKQNTQNRDMSSRNKTGYRGVIRSKQNTTRVWAARIHIDGKLKYLGAFENILDAAKAYDRAAKQHFGEFAALNFPEGAR